MSTLSRRKFLVLSGAAALAATAAACSSGSENTSGSNSASQELTKDTSASLILAYWDKNQTPTIEANLASFKEKYPNIQVTTNLAGYKDYWQKMKTQAEGGQLPDVMWMNGPNIQLYATNEMLVPLDDITTVEWDQYPKALVDLYTVDGKHYGIPKDYDTIGVFVNASIFKAAGVELPSEDWTWDDFHAAAKAISDWGKADGIWGCATTINGDGQGTYYNTMFQAGGFVIDGKKSGFDDPKSIKGLQCWADWVADGSVAPPKIVVDTKPSDMFRSGKSAMYWAGDWTVSEVAEDFKGREDEVVILPLPKDEKRATVIHGLGWSVSQHSKQQAAAKALAAHMAAKTSQEVEAKNGTAIPAYQGTQKAWVEAYPQWNCQLFVDAADDYAVPYPVSVNTNVWANVEGDYLTPAFAGEKPVAEAAKELADFMNTALAKE